MSTNEEATIIADTASAPASAPGGDLRLILADELHESPWNPRQHYPEGAMNELIESMRSSGFREWLPVVVRPDEAGGFEIGAGHRRRRAAEAAGIRWIPCLVRDLSDAEFLDVLNFDNSGRENVHPLHEAAGWRQWMDKTGKGVLDIAAKIGQSKEYVYQRLKYAALIEPAAKAFLEGEITAGHAILIARLEPKAQERALKFALAADWRGARPGVRALADHLHQDAYVDLKVCPFDPADRALVAGAVACGDCSKRAANIPGFEFDPEHPDVDICTDRACYQQKLDNHLIRIRTAIEASGEKVLTVSDSYQSRKKGVPSRSEYDIVQPGAKGAQQALVVDGSEVGHVITIKLRPAQQSGSSAAKPSKEETEKVEQAREARCVREIAIRRAILDAVCAKMGGLTRADIEALLAVVIDQGDGDAELLSDFHGIKCQPYQGTKELVAALPKMKEPELYRLLPEIATAPEFDEWSVKRDEPPTQLLAWAKRYKVDVAKIRSGMEEQAKEAEGGTRKEVIKQLPAMNAPKPTAAKKKKLVPAKKPSAKKAAKKGGKK